MALFAVQDLNVEQYIKEKIASLMVDFQLSDIAEVPLEITHHKIDELFLIIARDIPTWIVLTKDEYKLYTLIEKKLTLSPFQFS